MIADIQKIEAAARMSMGDYDIASRETNVTRSGFSTLQYTLAGLLGIGIVALAFV